MPAREPLPSWLALAACSIECAATTPRVGVPAGERWRPGRSRSQDVPAATAVTDHDPVGHWIGSAIEFMSRHGVR
jgi:hypothetical protein